MKNDISFEYVCEYVDDYDDILHSDYSNKLSEIWPPSEDFIEGAVSARIAVIRYWGNNEEGEQGRGYAYPMEEYFSSGHKVPKSYFNALKTLTETKLNE